MNAGGLQSFDIDRQNAAGGTAGGAYGQGLHDVDDLRSQNSKMSKKSQGHKKKKPKG